MSKKEKNVELDAAFIISQAKPRNRELHSYKPEDEEKEEEAFDEISEDVSNETVSSAHPREDNRRRKGKTLDYEMLFIHDSSATTRGGKGVYIRKEFHDRIMRIVQVIGHNKVSLFSYLDNVLEHHFNHFQDDISELYKKRNTDIF